RATSTSLSIRKYDSVGALPPSGHASSAMRTWRAPRSQSAKTATVWRPDSRAARMTRTAISPRFATRTLRTKPQLYFGELELRLLSSRTARDGLEAFLGVISARSAQHLARAGRRIGARCLLCLVPGRHPARGSHGTRHRTAHPARRARAWRPDQQLLRQRRR